MQILDDVDKIIFLEESCHFVDHVELQKNSQSYSSVTERSVFPSQMIFGV